MSTADARPVDARIHVVHTPSGFAVEARALQGRFLVQGLEPGGPYTVTVRAIGSAPMRRENVFLRLGELSDIHVVLRPLATRLDTVTVVAGATSPYSPTHADGGTGMTISASTLERLPSLNRDLYDFVRLVPQVSTKISLANPGLSAGGVGFRFNNFLINGVSDRTLSGNVSGAFAGRRSIPLAAVQEYQVLLSPYDVRYGDFTGALVNAITRSGTNTFQGSLFAYVRNDRLARRSSAAAITPYEKSQLGFSLGGPIIRDRLHFFVAPELQHFTYPASGPYLGQPQDAERPVPVGASDLARFDTLMRGYGLTAGSAGPAKNSSPLRNLFTRLDLALPGWNSRLLAWHNMAASDDRGFSRAARDTFSLASYQLTRASRARTTALHLHTALPRSGGGHNELLLSYRADRLDPLAPVRQPIVRVAVPALSGGRVTLNSGTNENAQGAGIRASAFNVKDNLTIPLGPNHVVTLGAEAERFRIHRGAGGAYGTWSFASLSDFAAGRADRYDVRLDMGSSDAPMMGTQYAAYAGDRWQPGDRLSLSAGLRADLLTLGARAPFHPLVDSLFGRRTDDVPRSRVELSPRVGFTWDVSGTQRHHVRGGAGIFTARYPLAWAHSALSSHGVGGVLRCSSVGPRFPPFFNPDHTAPPAACIGASSIAADVNLLDPDLRMMRVLRGSLAYDRRLPWSILLINEVLVTRALSDFVFLNLNLPEPAATDANGRVMYGTIRPNGLVSPAPRSAFSEVIDLRNTSRNRSHQISTRLEKTGARGTSGAVSYTYSRTRDVQTPLRVNTRGTATWASARATSGRHDDLSAGISSNDVPHRIIAAGTYVSPWTRARTELSFYYVGESGRPFTYVASGTLGRGDLNGDGSSANDPIYVPRDAMDTLEIALSGFSDLPGADNTAAAQAQRERAQRTAFASLVERTPCMRRQGGQILRRNTCREPWSNTTIASLRQAVPFSGREFDVQFDVFNVLNLLNPRWGRRREAAPALLEHVGQVAGPGASSRPVFRFDPTAPDWTTVAAESAYQLQLALHYRF